MKILKKAVFFTQMALSNIRSRFFHTFLSVLGIVIGVAALVGILSLIDGAEKYAHSQISGTTDFEAVALQTERFRKTGKTVVQKENYEYLRLPLFRKLEVELGSSIKSSYLMLSSRGEVDFEGKKYASAIRAVSAIPADKIKIVHGKSLSQENLDRGDSLVLISQTLAAAFMAEKNAQNAIGQKMSWAGKKLKIAGIIEDNDKKVAISYSSIALLSEAELKANPPMAVFFAQSVEGVESIKTKIENWLSVNYKNAKEDFEVQTNQMRVAQVNQGFTVFRLIMGLIVGISVVVGGIGIMNVLLISISERTVEIGIRKALGAQKKDILLQFLAESVTISVFGSFLGLLLGVLASMAFNPIIKMWAEVPFEASFTLNTLLTVSLISILIGVVFGTYPAIRAARLDPVEAMRRE
jgi:putative ABC transport system permease protein